MSVVPTLQSYLDRITSEYRNQPKFVAYVTALIQPLLDSQALLRSLLEVFDIDTAVGVQLDAVGQWIGRSRFLEQPLSGIYFSFDSTGLGFDQGTWFGPFDAIDGLTSLDDTTYRALLYAKRIMNNWDGSIPQIAEAINALLAGTSPGSILMVVDNQDMSMTVGIAGQVPPAATISLLQGNYVPITPSGVGPNYLITSVNGSPLYGFDTENASISGFDVGAFAGAAGTGPGPVIGFSLVSSTPTTATFSWLAPQTGSGPYTYQLQEQIDAGIGGLWNSVGLPVSVTTTTVSLSPGGHNYAFQVFAINSGGPGAPSAAIDLSTGAPTNLNAAATAQLPALTAAVSGTVQGFQITAAVSLPPLSCHAFSFAGVVGHGSLVFSAVGQISDAAFATASIPPLVAQVVAIQSGIGFGVGGTVSLPPVATKATAALGVGQSIVITPFGSPSQAASFTVTGTMDGMLSVPTLSYIDDAGLATITGTAATETQTTISLTWSPDTDPPLTSIPVAGVTRTQFSFVHPAQAAGTHTLLVTNGSVSTTTSYVVTGSVESIAGTTVMTVGPSINASPTPGSAGSGALITITSGGQVAVNGATIGLTSQVTELYYTGASPGANGAAAHSAYQENASGNWYGPIVAGSGGSQIAGSPITGGGGVLTDGLNLSQTQVNAIASAINANQVGDNVMECFSGTCYVQNLRAGDVIIATSPNVQSSGVMGSLTDQDGNVWSLVAGVSFQGNPPAWWWGAIQLNGAPVYIKPDGSDGYGGYFIALRLLNNGHVYVEEAKQGGWWDLTTAQETPGDFASFTRPVPGGTNGGGPDPGPGPNN